MSVIQVREQEGRLPRITTVTLYISNGGDGSVDSSDPASDTETDTETQETVKETKKETESKETSAKAE